MAMARLVSQALSNTSISGLSLTPRILSHPRHRSGKANNAQIIEIDLDSSSSSPSSTSASTELDPLNGGIRKLEEVIQSMVVRRAAPDWLPFRPGASYWVPPFIRSHSYNGVVEVIGRLSDSTRAHTDAQSSDSSSSGFLSDDEMMSFSSDRGWPSSCYFVPAAESVPSHPIPMFEVKITETEESVSSDRDEEG